MQNDNNSIKLNCLDYHPLKDSLQIVNNKVRIPISMAKSIFASKAILYCTLSNLGLYLPESDSKGCTTEYLIGASNQKYFHILKSEVKPPVTVKKLMSEIDLVMYLEEKYLRLKPMGF